MPGRVQTLPLEQKFGRLSPLYPCCRLKRDGKKVLTQWVCRCDCGAVVVRPRDSLVGGRTTSCGCQKNELRKTHGMTPRDAAIPKVYRAWSLMKNRCLNPKNKDYSYYGGRGIKICQEWIDSFEAFYRDMGDPPTPQHTLDRTEVNGNYCPENCEWQTRTHQSRNRRTNRIVVARGESMPLSVFCEKYSLEYDKAKYALNKGLLPEQILAGVKNA